VKVGGMFPSQWLKSTDIPDDQSVRVVMDRVEVEEVGDGPKPVLYFQGKQKGLVLNKTNYGVIAAAHGDESDDWQRPPRPALHGRNQLPGAVEDGHPGQDPQAGPAGRGPQRCRARGRPAARAGSGQSTGQGQRPVDEDVPIYTDADGNEVKEEDIPF
jgi:hypothetical protein